MSVVRFFLPLLFADAASLGWDPTVVPSGTAGQYDITVHDANGAETVFRTLGLISSTRTELEAGKGTRIWKAVEVRDGSPIGDPAVLKDVWRHEELGREGDIHESILHCDSSQEAQDSLSQGTLTVLHYGDVLLHSVATEHPYIDYTRQHPQNALRFMQDQPLTDSRFLSAGEQIKPHVLSEGGERLLLGRRVHYRIVFKELCTPLFSGHRLAAVFRAIGDVCEGNALDAIRH